MHTLALINVHTSGLHRRYTGLMLISSLPEADSVISGYLQTTRLTTFSTRYELQKPASSRPNHHQNRRTNPNPIAHRIHHTSGFLQTALSKLPRKIRPRIPRVSGRGSPDRVLSFSGTYWTDIVTSRSIGSVALAGVS